MMSAHRTVPQFGPSRRSPFRFAAAALCTAFVLMAASGCTPMRKQGAVPTFPAITMNDAVEAYQMGDCRESIRRFSAALQQQEHPALLNGLGMAYLSCNQPRNAAQAFERAVSISPGSAALHANAGTALYADNDYKSAERQFDAALRIDPTNPEALVGKAGILIQRKEPEKALRQLSLVSGTDAASPEVLYNKALAMYQMGLTDDAGTDLGTYAREHPNDAEAQNALGVVMLRAGTTPARRRILIGPSPCVPSRVSITTTGRTCSRNRRNSRPPSTTTRGPSPSSRIWRARTSIAATCVSCCARRKGPVRI